MLRAGPIINSIRLLNRMNTLVIPGGNLILGLFDRGFSHCLRGLCNHVVLDKGQLTTSQW